MLIVLIPTTDAVIGRLYLKHLCETENGLKVYRVAEHVESFIGNADEKWVKKYGFKFVEECYSSLNCYRFIEKNGDVVREDKTLAVSQYSLRHSYGDENSVYSREQDLIEDSITGDVLASDTVLAYKGGWVERFLGAFSDAGAGNVAFCSHNPYPDNRIENLIKSTLKP